MKMLKTIFGLGVFIAASISLPVLADTIDCQIYSIEDISAGNQHRARIFVMTTDYHPEQSISLGYAVARNEAFVKNLDYVSVFVTRKIDGVNRDDHRAGTALTWIKLNLPNTTVLKGEMKAKVVTEGVFQAGDLAVLLTEKREISGDEVRRIFRNTQSSGVKFSCVNSN